MANTGISISIELVGDGTSTVFAVDLKNDPYAIAANVVNWFSRDCRTSSPVGISGSTVISESNGVGGEPISLTSAVLSGSVLTITISVAMYSGNSSQFSGNLLFGA